MTLAMDPRLAARNVSRETEGKLHAHIDLLRKWNSKINLVSRSAVDELWDRHTVDSAQIYDLAPDSFQSWVDVGSGGGFPGIVIAALSAQFMPNATITLIESDQRKATFLREVARELDLKCTVLAARIEAVGPVGADVISARALAPLHVLLGFAERHLRPGGTALFLKGKTVEQEIDEARTNWLFNVDKHTSMTDAEGRILRIKDIRRV